MRPKRSGCPGGKWRITPAASMRCRAPSCWHARVGKWSARPRRKGGGRGCVNWHRRKVAPEQRPTHPYVAPHTAKIHTLITLGVSILRKPLVLKARQRLPRGFDSHRPLHFWWPGVSLRCPRTRFSASRSSHSLDAATTVPLIECDRSLDRVRSRWSHPSVIDPLRAFANGGNTDMKVAHKPASRAQVDCQNDFFLSGDWRVRVVRLRADISTKSKNKIGSRAADLWHRERGFYDLDR